jgi:hypothetical protein
MHFSVIGQTSKMLVSAWVQQSTSSFVKIEVVVNNQFPDPVSALISYQILGQNGMSTGISDPNAVLLGRGITHKVIQIESVDLYPGSNVIDVSILTPELTLLTSCKVFVENQLPAIMGFSPMENDTISFDFPLFSWSIPNANYQYCFSLYKIESEHTGIRAVQNELPILQLTNLRNNVLVYSSAFPPLEKGVSYLWSISTMDKMGNCVVNNQNAWIFHVEKQKSLSQGDSAYLDAPFIDLSLKSQRGVYYTDQFINFYLRDNSYQENNFLITVFDAENQPVKTSELLVRDLGNGRFSINLGDVSGLVPGSVYSLHVYNDKSEDYFLQFLKKSNPLR